LPKESSSGTLKIATLISLAQAEGQIDAEEAPDLLAALFINCWQGAAMGFKCDPSARATVYDSRWIAFSARSRLDAPKNPNRQNHLLI
jgi:hypothetical protein